MFRGICVILRVLNSSIILYTITAILPGMLFAGMAAGLAGSRPWSVRRTRMYRGGLAVSPLAARLMGTWHKEKEEDCLSRKERPCGLHILLLLWRACCCC